MSQHLPRRHFTVDEYDWMIEAGVFGVDDRLELIEGEILELSPNRQVKIPLYARSDIREAWLINLRDNVVEIYRDPIDGLDRTVQVARPGERIFPPAFPDQPIAVDSLLG